MFVISVQVNNVIFEECAQETHNKINFKMVDFSKIMVENNGRFEVIPLLLTIMIHLDRLVSDLP